MVATEAEAKYDALPENKALWEKYTAFFDRLENQGADLARELMVGDVCRAENFLTGMRMLREYRESFLGPIRRAEWLRAYNCLGAVSRDDERKERAELIRQSLMS